jgi:hypothetical protein
VEVWLLSEGSNVLEGLGEVSALRARRKTAIVLSPDGALRSATHTLWVVCHVPGKTRDDSCYVL